MMRSLISAVIGLLLVFTIIGCGGDDDGGAVAAGEFGVVGPYETVLEDSADFVWFYPSNLGEPGIWPALVWYNGASGYSDDNNYNPLLESLASWGFVVVGGKSPGRNPPESNQLDELARRASSAGDALDGKVDLDRVGVAGHSLGAFESTIDGAMFRAVAAVQGGFAAAGSAPTFYSTAVNDTTVPPQSVRDAFETTEGPDWFASHSSADHSSPRRDGGPYRAALIAFFRWRLDDDRSAAAWFEGPDCLLCGGPEWEYATRNPAP